MADQTTKFYVLLQIYQRIDVGEIKTSCQFFETVEMVHPGPWTHIITANFPSGDLEFVRQTLNDSLGKIVHLRGYQPLRVVE